MSHTYQINENVITDADGSVCILYGIDALDENGDIVASFTKVFFQRSRATALVDLCNECKLSVTHLKNMVDDSLYEQATALKNIANSCNCKI